LDLVVGEWRHRLALQNNDSDRCSFAEHRNAEYGANAAHFSLFNHLVARIGEHVRNLDRSTLRDNAADDRAATRRQRVGLDIGLEVGRVSATRYLPIDVPLRPIYGRHVGLAEICRRLDQRVEHGLQIERRAADDLEDVGGGGLLLKRFAQLIEQASVLDGDDSLAGEILEQTDLLLGEWADVLAIDGDAADQIILLDHWYLDE